MRFKYIDQNSDYLKEVIDLGNKHSKTLGFMPEGGFVDHARKKWIVVALKDDIVVGYLLFRLGKKNLKVSITHLCVKEDYRGQNIAFKLIDQLKEKYQNVFTGITLSCRTDYTHASKLWDRYGFIKKNEVRSRSIEENYLIKWWYDFNNLDLFQLSEKYSDKMKVLLDANILIKLRDKNLNEYKEVESLVADWLIDEVDYYFAQEMFNEICRDSDKSRANRTRIFLQNYHEAKFDVSDFSEIEKELQIYLKGTSTNDVSDRKQLAECIAAGIEYFITGDKNIHTVKDIIENTYNVLILTPTEFLLEIDQLKNSSEYYPIRLAGAVHTTKKVDKKELNQLADIFLCKSEGELKNELQERIEKLVKESVDSELKVVLNPKNETIAVWGNKINENELFVPLLRVVDNNLSMTLFSQLMTDIVEFSILHNLSRIVISEKYISKDWLNIIQARGFSKIEENWVKIVLNDFISSNQLLKKYPFIKDHLEPDILKVISSNDNPELKQSLLYEIERRFFPLKIADLEMPCYIIPIKPYWASQLFDKLAASQMIFGANPEKIWNHENVYYRNIKPVTEKFPARILWYVSSQDSYSRQKSIVATSYLNDMTVDKVKKQFRKYKKFGIYEWKDIYELAKYEIENEVKAIVFSNTEVFQKVIPFDKVTEILLSKGFKRNTFTSPLEVNKDVFKSVYGLANV
ncbi:MAG: GNAT family N-acetyltransferase [Draconibacterium sp.]